MRVLDAVLISLFAGVPLGGVFAGPSDPGERKFLYDCPMCNGKPLGSPQPQSYTLDRLVFLVAGTSPAIVPGDKVTICNDYQCVTYEFTANGRWQGAPPERQVNNGGGNGTERPPGPPPRNDGSNNNWRHVCGRTSIDGASRLDCFLMP